MNPSTSPNNNTGQKRKHPPSSSSSSVRQFGTQARRIRSHDADELPPQQEQEQQEEKEQVESSRASMGAFFPDLDKIDPNPPAPRATVPKPKMDEPSEESVAMMVSIGVDQVTAVRYLKAKRNDLDAAVNAFYDGEDVSAVEKSEAWDDRMFTDGDRDGNPNLHPLGATAPPSRAPSRTGLHPGSKAEEDADLQAAINMSQSQNLGGFQQEGGVISADGKTTFGPANRDTYDSSQWAMVPRAAAHDTNEIVPDVDLEAQKYVPGEPRALKPVPNGDYMANLMGILHSIPKAREAFIMREHVQSDYGQDEEWWKGNTITMPTVVHLDDGRPVDAGNTHEGFVTEVQRLIAFLDASERGVGSGGALTQTDAIRDSDATYVASRTLIELFMKSWTAAALARSGKMEEEHLLFANEVTTSSSEGHIKEEKTLIDIPVNIAQGATELSLLLDSVFWSNDTAERIDTDQYLDKPAELFVIQLRQEDTSGVPLRVDVPAELYLDKYTGDNLSAIFESRELRAAGLSRLQKINEIERRLTEHPHPQTGAPMSAITLLSNTMARFNGHHPDENKEIQTPPTPMIDDHAKIATKLDKLINNINFKIMELNVEKENTLERIRQTSLNPPNFPPTYAQKLHYTLRGVATKPHITYILRPIAPTLDEIDDASDAEMLMSPASDDATPPGMQWWRIEYEVSPDGASARVTRTKTADYDVLRAAELENGAAMLVYASDAACDQAQTQHELPLALQNFVERDNALFRADLANASPPAYGGGVAVSNNARPSIERTSFDSTRAEGSEDEHGGLSRGSPPPYEDEAFMGRNEFGLGLDVKGGWEVGEEEVDEITLDDREEQGAEMEMVETKHRPLIPGVGDQGKGGAEHVEDAEMGG